MQRVQPLGLQHISYRSVPSAGGFSASQGRASVSVQMDVALNGFLKIFFPQWCHESLLWYQC